MPSSGKPNLILVHGFPYSGLMLQGFYNYLDAFFNVYPIELPGLHPAVKPLKKVSFDAYVAYVEAEIAKKECKNYFLSGISFGFALVNACQVDPRCQGYVAIAPYLNRYSVADACPFTYRVLLHLIPSLGLSKIALQTSPIKTILHKKISNQAGRVQKTLAHIDPYTFFTLLRLILSYKGLPTFHPHLPYLLIMNEKDETIRYPYVRMLFEQNIEKELFHHMPVELPHAPARFTSDYFQAHIDAPTLQKNIEWIEEKAYAMPRKPV